MTKKRLLAPTPMTPGSISAALLAQVDWPGYSWKQALYKVMTIRLLLISFLLRVPLGVKIKASLPKIRLISGSG